MLSDFIEKKERVKQQRKSIMLPPGTHTEVCELADEEGLTHPELVDALMKFYRQSKKKKK